jgi:uncharacterized protein (DUF2252 family)
LTDASQHQTGEGLPSPADASTHQRESRKLRGKALRKTCPRSSHAGVTLGQGTRDALALIEESDRDRVPKLLPIRFTRMAESPFAFFRGSAILQAHDLKGTPSAGLSVQCCGDCHLMNFGGFATPQRTLVFDINDFDETLRGPFEWDVKRLATSFVLAARSLGFGSADGRQAAESVVANYRTALAGFAEMSVLETWYARVSMDEAFEEYVRSPKVAKLLRKSVDKALHSTTEHVFHKLTAVANARPRITDQAPLLFHPDPSELDIERDVRPFFENYRATLSRDRQALFDRFHITDVVYKVVGVGSVGTRCLVALFTGDQDDHLFLQVKESRSSVLEGLAGPCPFTSNGERVVEGQRLMQSASDIFLGWTRGMHGHDFYVRQLRDMKIAPNLTGYTPRSLDAYGHLCGRALARAHARSGDAAALSGYLGAAQVFDEAVAAYALAYADQVERDYESFRAAIRAGRFPIETVPPEIEPGPVPQAGDTSGRQPSRACPP